METSPSGMERTERFDGTEDDPRAGASPPSLPPGRAGLGARQKCRRLRLSALGPRSWHRTGDRWRLPTIPEAQGTSIRIEHPLRQQPLPWQAPNSYKQFAISGTRNAPVPALSAVVARPGNAGRGAPVPLPAGGLSRARCGPPGPRSPGDGAAAAPSAGEGPGAAGEPAPTCGHPRRRGPDVPGLRAAARLRHPGTSLPQERPERRGAASRPRGSRRERPGQPDRGHSERTGSPQSRQGSPLLGTPSSFSRCPCGATCGPRSPRSVPRGPSDLGRVPELGALGAPRTEGNHSGQGPGEARGQRCLRWKFSLPPSLCP